METLRIETPDGLGLRTAHHPADASKGTVVLAYGITRDMDEGGMYVRLAEKLSRVGFDVVRFTYRGHGESDGTDLGVTIGGELLDFQTAFEHARARFEGPYFVVAQSFGAVSTCLSLDRFADAGR
jgi:predicted alpha/beta hydrolase